MADELKDPTVKPVPKGHRWILFVSGPTASGKTSVAKYLAEKLDLKFVEGDDVCVTHLLEELCTYHFKVPSKIQC